MENPYKRKKEPEINRQLILDAAVEIGADEGWHQVTFQAIASKTGISKGGIIHHFSSKEYLLEEIMKRGLSELTDWLHEEGNAPSNEQTASLAYLNFVIKKSDDPKYRKTMKVVMRVVMFDPKYLNMWDEWFSKHIRKGQRGDIDSLIVMLVADGLWYADNLELYGLDMEVKEQILNRLSTLSKKK